VAVAVRSSATAEDLPGMSAAGQHDTYLNVRGEAAVLDAVRRCWASLWSARAIGYRARRGIEPGDVSIAVVVQRLVPAEAAGVMFTTDPVDGAHDTVVVSANWGLGESVVAGEVTPDVAVVDRASGTLVSYRVGSKETMTVADGTATRVAGTPPGLRSAAVLSPDQAAELAQVGLAIEKLYGEPVDIEWALAAGDLSVVQGDPRKAAAARKLVARWAPVARDREAARSEAVRSAWVARTWVRRAGALTGHGDDLFFLELPETAGLLRGDRAPLATVPARRAAYETYRALPPYPALIRGRFDPVSWAADPGRRSDYYDEHAQTARPDDTITGFPGAAGVVEGTVRILRTPEEASRLGDGEILVAPFTNIGWTPVFPRAAAVVTDIGAPLSHAAIVARELGIPAVVGCGNATIRLRTGDRVRVDGSHGTVEVLRQASTRS
jgi:phosphoenolpyruvate synthase/pyruvate phosphate dikinase